MNKRILIVDDDPAVCMVVQTSLEDEGYAVQAATGAVALRLAQRQTPDLILLDLRMPGMDGPEVRRRLLDDRRTARIPVVVMSSETYIAQAAWEMHAQACLPKPFDIDDLLALVRSATTA